MTQQNELSIRAEFKDGLIEFNYEELKSKVTESMVEFKEMKISSSMVGDAKKTRADLNKLKTAVDDKRKQVKKEYMKKFEDFETKVKEIVSIIDEGVVNIDTQIKACELLDRQAKEFEINMYFSDLGFDVVPLTRLFDQTWLNITVTEKQWKEKLNEKIEAIKNDLEIISNMAVEDVSLLKSFYLETLNITLAKSKYDYIFESKKKFETIKPEKVEEVIEEEKSVVNNAEFIERETTVNKLISVKTTQDKMDRLFTFMILNEIQYEAK